MKRVALRSVIAGALALPLALGAFPAHAASSANPRGGPGEARYFALGDSFASGLGAGEYFLTGGLCFRSSRAYPALLAAARSSESFQFIACGGSTTADVRRIQVPRLSRATRLVTLTVGGNDAGFSRALAACLRSNSTDTGCDKALDESERVLRDELPDKLRRTYREIAVAAPEARVVLAGYPHLFETGSRDCSAGTPARRNRINTLTDRLDDLIRKTGERQGFGFADVRGAFAGHGVCARAGTEEWIRPLKLLDPASFHPTAEGQRLGYLPVVGAVVRESAGGRRSCVPAGKNRVLAPCPPAHPLPGKSLL
jgi:lysophospholipase L1-like esterase